MTSIAEKTNASNLGQLNDPTTVQCHEAIRAARTYAISSMNTSDHWDGEVRSSVTLTALYVFLFQCLELDIEPDREALVFFLESQQCSDGSWSISIEHSGDLSVAVEVYLALKILGVDPLTPKMKLAKEFILAKGGMPLVRIFTRMYLAIFGLFSWDSLPQSLPELILLPNSAPISVYRFSSWARSSMIPLMIVCHHRPVYALPNGRSANNDYLDELWPNPREKSLPPAPPYSTLLRERNWFGFGIKLADALLYYRTKFNLPGCGHLRQFAVTKCMEWVLEHQEASGDWEGYMPPIHASIMAIHLDGIPIHDSRFKRALQALERLTINDRLGKRVQPCQSAVWDTALMAVGLLDTHRNDNKDLVETRKHVNAALGWLRTRQNIGSPGDWRVFRPFINSGGYSFGDYISRYPDVDDTRAVIIASIKSDPASVETPSVRAALDWVLGMQSSNGGWGTFDYDNDISFFNNDPHFTGVGVFFDPATADVTGGVLESLGLILARCQKHQHGPETAGLMQAITKASAAAVNFLVKAQERDGSWWGRWGCNYLYGTFCALSALEYFHGRQGYEFLDSIVEQGIDFISRWQNLDGGWGESSLSYNASSRTERIGMIAAGSTPSQTAWALMALLAFLPASDEIIMRGVTFLIKTQTEEGLGGQVNGLRPGDRAGRSWHEVTQTGTGFPSHLMLGYEFYCHYWPMMALGRFVSKRRQNE